MKVLVVGGGGREHALCWSLAASPLIETLYCAPGNAGIGHEAICVPIKVDDLDGMVAFAVEKAMEKAIKNCASVAELKTIIARKKRS